MLYYQDEWVTQHCSDALTVLRGLESDTVDLLCTDPPYGIGFMGKDWDKALPDKRIWAECLRVLKPGSFAFVMSIPRSDCLSRMIISLEDAGFMVNFTPIFWAYASGFPKAQNIGKAVDKRLGVERQQVKATGGLHNNSNLNDDNWNKIGNDDATMASCLPSTPQAKALDGSYGGFQPKPAVEVIIVAMKPLSEKTFVDQALKNRKGITWLDDCRVPYESEGDKESSQPQGRITGGIQKFAQTGQPELEDIVERCPSNGRFPANLLVSDDVLNDGKSYRASGSKSNKVKYSKDNSIFGFGADSSFYTDIWGSFSRYFDLDKWWQTKLKEIAK